MTNRNNKTGLDSRVTTVVEVYNRYRAFNGTSLRNIKIKLLEKYFYISKLSIIEISKIEEYDNLKPSKILQKVFELLPHGALWFMPVKGMKKSFYIKLEDGYLCVSEGNFQAEPKWDNIDAFSRKF